MPPQNFWARTDPDLMVTPLLAQNIAYAPGCLSQPNVDAAFKAAPAQHLQRLATSRPKAGGTQFGNCSRKPADDFSAGFYNCCNILGLTFPIAPSFEFHSQ